MREGILDRILKNKPLSIVLAFVLLGLVLLPFFFIHPSKSGTKTPKVNEVSQVPIPATIVGGDALYSWLRDDVAYKNLRLDLAHYYHTSMKKSDDPAVFTIKSNKDNESTLTIVGTFQSGGKLSIEISPPKHGIVALKATNLGSKKDISSSFESNSSKSRFIQTLPIIDSNYTIDYSDATGGFTVALYDNKPELLAQAQNVIMKALQLNDLSNTPVSYTFPLSSAASNTPTDNVQIGE